MAVFKDKKVRFEVHPDRNGASVAMILDNCRFDAAVLRYIKWVKNQRGSGFCISRDQLVYFGATASDLAQYDAAIVGLR